MKIDGGFRREIHLCIEIHVINYKIVFVYFNVQFNVLVLWFFVEAQFLS